MEWRAGVQSDPAATLRASPVLSDRSALGSSTSQLLQRDPHAEPTTSQPLQRANVRAPPSHSMPHRSMHTNIFI